MTTMTGTTIATWLGVAAFALLLGQVNGTPRAASAQAGEQMDAATAKTCEHGSETYEDGDRVCKDGHKAVCSGETGEWLVTDEPCDPA